MTDRDLQQKRIIAGLIDVIAVPAGSRLSGMPQRCNSRQSNTG